MTVDEYRAVFDFGNADIKKGECSTALVVYDSLIVGRSSRDAFYDKIFVAGNGLNEVVTNLGKQRFAITTNPFAGYAPGSRPL